MTASRIPCILVTFLALVVSAAFGGSMASAAAPAGALRIGVLPITDVVPFYIAQDQGYFTQEGLHVELVPVASAAERDQLMAAQQIDGQLNDLVSTVLFNAQRPRIQIVRKGRQAFAHAAQFWILVPKDSPLRTVQDLKGVEIGISQNSIIEYITHRLLEREGLAAPDIRTTNVPAIPTRFQLLMQGQLRAVTLPDPLASLALLRGARSVVDDSRHPDLSQSVISFQAPIVQTRADEVRRFLAAYDRAVQDIRTRPDRFRNILIAKSRVPDPLKDTYRFPPFPDPSVPRPDQWDDVVAWALQKGLIRQALPYAASVTPAFLK